MATLNVVAEAISEGLNEVGGVETSVMELNDIPNYDVILIGSPNHMGWSTRSIKEFIDKLSELQLGEKMFAVYDTYMGKDFEKAVKKMEKQIAEKVPKLKRVAQGLSIKVNGMRGPLADGELEKCRELGKNITVELKTNFKKIRIG